MIIIELVKVFFIVLFLVVIFKRKNSRYEEYIGFEDVKIRFLEYRLWKIKLFEVEKMRK